MKKLLIASTALSLAGGAAFAEISISGDAELGVDYNSEAGEGMSKHSFVHEVGIDFSASGTTDGGLTFGGSAGFDTNDDMVNLGTVHVSGSFGTLTIGDNDPGSFIAGGIADIGMNGIGVDDMAENLRKGTASQLRYDNSFGQVSIAISAGTKDGKPGVAAVAAKPGLWTLSGRTSDVVGNSIVNQSSLDAFDIALEIIGRLDDGTATTDFLPVAPTGTDPLAKLREDGFVFEITRTPAKGETKEKIVVSTDASPAVANRADIAGYYKKGDAVMNADGKALAAVGDVTIQAQQYAFDTYAAAYDLGADGKVGGGDDTPKAAYAALLNQAIAPVDAMPAVPAGKSETEFAFGMNFETGGVTIGLGYDSNKTISMGAGFSAGEISTNLLYVKMDDDEDTDKNEEATSMGVDLSYSMGASKVTLAYGRHKPEEKGMEAMDAVGMGVTHDLGGGATMNAGFGKVDVMDADTKKIVSQNKASIGLMFAF